MFRSLASHVAIALVLAGCGGFGSRDPSAVSPTAVVETHLVSEGIKEFPAFESTTRTYTRANMQRSESTVTGVGTFARFLGSSSSDTRIERLDRKLAWTLDAKAKQYSECPLKGCPVLVPKKPTAKKPTDPVKTREEQCRLKIGNSTLSIEPTGQKRSINGFESDQYDVRWLVTLRDNASRQSTSSLSIDLWTTPVTPAMKDAMALEKTFDRARDKILGITADADRSIVLPPEVGRMMTSYLSLNVSPPDRATLLAAAKKLDKVKGRPVLMDITWNLSGEACAMDETLAEIGDKPLFKFTSEIRVYKLEAARDSLFIPPKDYKRMK